MPTSELRLYLDNSTATAQQLDLFGEVRVDQAIGMASEAELTMAIGTDANGNWSGIEEGFAQPFRRVRIEIKVGEGGFVPLIDGPIVAQRFELSAAPDSSELVLVVQDDSVLLNQNEEVAVFENQAPDAIASTLFGQFGLTTDADSVSVPAGGPARFIVQRGTAMQLLRELARRHGMFVYVTPGVSVGRSIGVFKRPVLAGSDYTELLLVGAERNLEQLSVQLDGLRPLQARADSVDITNQGLLTHTASTSDISAQGATGVHTIVQAGTALLAHTREAESDLEAATTAAVDHSAWAYSASGEVVADNYDSVLQPYRSITLRGAGGYLSGDWLISRVTHVYSDEGYRQQFTLRRNARSAGGSGGAGAIPGGLF